MISYYRCFIVENLLQRFIHARYFLTIIDRLNPDNNIVATPFLYPEKLLSLDPYRLLLVLSIKDSFCNKLLT